MNITIEDEGREIQDIQSEYIEGLKAENERLKSVIECLNQTTDRASYKGVDNDYDRGRLNTLEYWSEMFRLALTGEEDK